MKNFKIILVIILSLITKGSFAQSECEDKILEAQKLYEDGEYNKVANALESVLLECDLSKTKKSEVMKYLTSSYYELDELEEADKRMVKFIKKNPYHELNAVTDPYAFRQEYPRFKNWPLFSVGISAGIPINNVIVEKVYPVLQSDEADYNQPVNSKKAMSFMLDIGWNINKYISINPGAGVSLFRLSQNLGMYPGLQFNYEESIIQYSASLYLKFSYPLKNGLMPSVFFGAEYVQIYDSKYSYNYSQNGDIETGYEFMLFNRKRENVKIDHLNERNSSRNVAFVGARLAYRLNKIDFFAEFRYRQELDLYNKPDQRFFHTDLFITNNYVLPDLKIETYQISLGVNFNFLYKVKSKY